MIQRGALKLSHGVTVEAPNWLADDPGADHLDAVFCAIQGAWSWMQRDHHFGLPLDFDPLESWIADASL